MEIETPTNPVEGEDTALATLPENTEVDAIEPELDEDGNPIPPTIEEEEIDLDDLKLKLPKDQAEKVRQHLLRQADYTRKTQEVAETRKALEAERAQFHQASNQEREAELAVRFIDAQLAQYAQINWAAEMQAADANFDDARKSQIQAAFMTQQQLQNQRGAALAQYQGLKQQRELEMQQSSAKQIEEGRAAVAKIPGWSEQVGAELKAFAIKEVGFTDEEIGDEISFNPKVARALMLARKGLEAERNAAKAQQHVQAQQVTPAAKAGGGQAAAPAKGLDDRLNASEWHKRWQAQRAQGR